jgi:hypothetical protein
MVGKAVEAVMAQAARVADWHPQGERGRAEEPHQRKQTRQDFQESQAAYRAGGISQGEHRRKARPTRKT